MESVRNLIVGAGISGLATAAFSPDPDYLVLRLGTADLPSAVELTDPTADEHRKRLHWLIPDSPVAVPLVERGVAG